MSEKNSKIPFVSARMELKESLKFFLKKNKGTFFAIENLVREIKFPKLVRKAFSSTIEREWEIVDALEQLVEENFITKEEFEGNTYFGIR